MVAGGMQPRQPRSQPFFWVLPSPRADLPSLALWRVYGGQGPGRAGGSPLLSQLIRIPFDNQERRKSLQPFSLHSVHSPPSPPTS